MNQHSLTVHTQVDITAGITMMLDCSVQVTIER